MLTEKSLVALARNTSSCFNKSSALYSAATSVCYAAGAMPEPDVSDRNQLALWIRSVFGSVGRFASRFR